MQFDFLAILIVFVFKFIWVFFVFKFFVALLLVVQGGTEYLPMPPSWLEVLLSSVLIIKIKTRFD